MRLPVTTLLPRTVRPELLGRDLFAFLLTGGGLPGSRRNAYGAMLADAVRAAERQDADRTVALATAHARLAAVAGEPPARRGPVGGVALHAGRRRLAP